MKYLLSILFISISFNVLAQEVYPALIDSSKTLNDAYNKSIRIDMYIDTTKNEYKGCEILVTSVFELNKGYTLKLISRKYPTLVNGGEKIHILGSSNKISLKVTNVSDGLIRLLEDSIADIYIQSDRDIFFKIKKDNIDSTLKTCKITKYQIEKYTSKKIYLTNSMAKELIEAKGGNVFISQNQIDIGVIPAENASSKKTEYTTSFKFRERYPFYSKFPLYFYTEGLVSTNSKDSLNYLSIYPVNYNFTKENYELIFQLGVEGNQTFTNYRISGNLFWNGIIPNLINLTGDEDRLRLKPVIKVGLKLYKEIKNNRPRELDSNKFSNQIYCEYYYYIPIQKIYSLKLEGSVFYDFNSKVNPNKNVMHNYSVILGIDIPKTDFKTIFKYVKGQSGISYEKNDYLMIGLMIDLFATKK